MEVTYSADGKTAFYCGYKFRKDPKTGYYLCSQKTDNGNRERLHNFVWRKAHGDIPKGYHIHHIDRNKNNNTLSNLIMLSQSEHGKVHKELLTEAEKELNKERLIQYALPKAREWHSTELGKQFHSEHAKSTWENRQNIKYKCTYCGCDFFTKNIYSPKANHFCSNKCKASHRRKSGVDDIEMQCQKCGNTFKANKYAKPKYCEDCRNRKHKDD